MSEFNAILLEGIFYHGDNPYPDAHGVVRDGFRDLLVAPSAGATQSVYEALKPLVGRRVQLAVHHVPNMPIDPTRWGGGCCHWETLGDCPFGHRRNPTSLYNVADSGVLVYDLDHSSASGGWWLETFDGNRIMLPLAHVLPGHYGRVAAATLDAVDEMRDALAELGQLGSVEEIVSKATDLQGVLDRLRTLVKED